MSGPDKVADEAGRGGDAAPTNDRASRLVLLAVGGLGFSSVITQLALMREMLGAFSGNEMVLGIILGNWLLLTGIGAALGRMADRLWSRGSATLQTAFAAGLVLIAVLPLAQVYLLRTLRDVVFVRGALVGVTETVLASFVLLLPYCIVSGFLLTLACTILAAKHGPAGIGRVYATDSIGSAVGGLLFSFVLVLWLDHFAMLYVPALLNLLLAGLLAIHFGRAPLLAAVAVVAVTVVGMMGWLNMDAVSTARQHPGQEVVFRRNSPYGRLIVTKSAGQLNFIENGLPIISTHNIEQVEEAVHYAMAQRPDARKVLLVSGGVSGTAREILKYGVAEVTYVELDPLIIEAGRKYLPDSLADPRIKIVNTDGRLFVKHTDQRYDVVIMDMPDPSTSQINRFYTTEFFGEVKCVLAKDGVLSFGLGRYENYVSDKLARMLASAAATLRRSFRQVLVVPGGRIFFLASDGDLTTDIAARIRQAHIQTQLVNRHYLDAMLTPDRMADMQRATARHAAVNEDFNPVLYYYHLVNWMSQFKVRFGVLEVVLLVAMAVYLSTIRPVPLAIFVSGFAASALEIVLLLGFQILYGSVYRQVGVIVTMFMMGLAVGALVVNRRLPEVKRAHLAGLAFAIAGLACLLPVMLMALTRLETGTSSLVLVQGTIAFVTLLLGLLVGMEFPVASRVEFERAATTAARLYTADFVGACLGALLASTFLIPLIGVTAVCLMTAGLNALGGAVVLLRKG